MIPGQTKKGAGKRTGRTRRLHMKNDYCFLCIERLFYHVLLSVYDINTGLQSVKALGLSSNQPTAEVVNVVGILSIILIKILKQ